MNQIMILTFHSKEHDCVRRYTAVGIVKDKIMAVGLAITSPHDQFSRKRGRQIAMGRAERAPFVHVTLPDNEPDNEPETVHNLFRKIATTDACKFIKSQLNIKPKKVMVKGVNMAQYFDLEKLHG